MITSVYGLPGLSLAELTYLITELGIGFMVANPRPTKIGKPHPNHVTPVVFGSAKTLIDNRDRIKFRACALVCDTFPRLYNELGWECVGLEVKKGYPEYCQFGAHELGLLLRRADGFTQPYQFNTVLKVYDPSNDIIERFGVSALNVSNNLMYKIKDQDLRARTFLLVRQWFTGLITTSDKLYTRLQALKHSERFLDLVHDALTNTDGQKLRRVVIESRAKPAQLEMLARKQNISPSDVRYLLSKPVKKDKA